jgi:hypothetical protein
MIRFPPHDRVPVVGKPDGAVDNMLLQELGDRLGGRSIKRLSSDFAECLLKFKGLRAVRR